MVAAQGRDRHVVGERGGGHATAEEKVEDCVVTRRLSKSADARVEALKRGLAAAVSGNRA